MSVVEHTTGGARHIPHASLSWDTAATQRAIDDIVEDACASSDAMHFWPAHPQDDGVEDGDTGLYIGAAGVIWALDHLTRTGATRHRYTVASSLDRLVQVALRQREALGDYG